MLLPLNDLQGEIRGLTNKNIFKSQLQTGAMEKHSIAVSVKESGATSITLTSGKDKVGDDEAMVLQECNCKFIKCSNQRCQQGTQTEAFTLPMAAMAVYESLEGTRETYVSTNNTYKNQGPAAVSR